MNEDLETGFEIVTVQLSNKVAIQRVLNHRQVDDSGRSPRAGRSISNIKMRTSTSSPRRLELRQYLNERISGTDGTLSEPCLVL